MIKTIATGTNEFIKITNTPGIYISPYGGSNSVSGAIRFNPNSQTLEVYDGNAWQNVTGHTDISFTSEMIDLLNWARKEMNKQKEYEQWAKTHPTVQSALSELQRAKEHLEVLTILCREEEAVK